MSATDPLREALERIASFVATSDRHAALSLPHLQAWAREALAAVPAEPEAWEWRSVTRLGQPTSGVVADREKAGEWAARGDAVERRRPGKAPGPWERVDPEPCEED